MALVLLSCGRESTTGPLKAPGGVARGLSFNTIFPSMPSLALFASVFDFNRVRVLLHHADGTIALDTTVAFPSSANAITLSFDVILAPGTPAAGELLTLNLAYVNAAGDTVFRGGPVVIRAAAALEGSPPPPPVSIPVAWTGPGAAAKTLKISPRSLTVNAGAPFSFTAVASDSAGAVVSNAVVAWGTPDPTLATIPVASSGAGTAGASRGSARIIAQLANFAADTVTLNVIPVPTAIAVASGNNQVGVIGKPTLQALTQPIAVRVTAADGLGVSGVSVTFAAANGGSVAATTVVTDAGGLAQTTWSLGTAGAVQTATATVASLAGSPVTFNATGVAKPATTLTLTSGPAAGVDIPSGTPTPLVIAARDVDGDPAVGFTGDVTVALSTNPAGGTLAGTTTVTAVGGVASFPAISIAKPGVGYVLQAKSGTLAPVSTNTFNIVTGPAATLTLVSGSGQTAEAGASVQPIKVLVTDVNGNVKAGATVAFAPGASFGTATPASAVTTADGTATFVWTLGPTLGAQTLSATTGSVSPLVVSATAVAVVREWVITQQPSASLTAGSEIAPAVKAELRNAFNVVVPSFNGPTNIGIGANPGSATLGGTLTVNAAAGVATFPGLSLNKSGTGYTLVISSPGTTQGTTNAISVTPATAATVVITSGSGQTGSVGAALPAPIVAVVNDAFGNPVTGASVSFAIAAGGGTVTPATGTTDASGRLSATWTLGSASAAQTLAVSSPSLATVNASAIATSPTRTLIITQQPGTAQTAGVAIAPAVSVEMRDGFNALVTSFTGPVAIAVGSNCCASTLSGSTTVNAVAGVATFPTIALDKRGGGYTLIASSDGATSATTTAFTVSPAAARFIAVTAGNGQSGAAGAALPTPLVALVTDNFGNGVAAKTVAIRVRTGGGSVSPASASTDSTGRVSATWTLGSASVSQALEFALSGIDSTTAAATTSSGATAGWFITTQPAATQTAGATITPGLVAELRDGAGAVVTSFNGATALSLASNSADGTLAGTTSVSAANGIATFSNTSLAKVGTYSFSVGSSGTTPATSSVVNVVAAAASSVSVESGGSQAGTFGATLAAPVVLRVVDAYGNAVSGTAVSFAVTSGGGSVGTPSATTDASGRASTTWTLGPSGPQMISGTSAGLTGSPLTISATTASGSVAQTIVSPRNDTLTSIGATRALSVQARDVAGNIVAGSFSWVSRDPSIATVSSGGVVTAIANGSIYVVATEIGGTRDSALIVVQQRTASVNITPGSRSLYVTGAFGYSAQAVDGRGNAMTVQPTFTWTSTVPSVASVSATSGAVTALAIGSTQIRATSGAIVGVSNLTVLTPITRIDVTFDSAAAATPDTFTMTALGLRRAYRAIARDTLLNVMTGVTFTWSSSNASVAAIDTPGATTAGAISAANGVTSIQASAQGVTGKATLFVAQVLSSIELTPASITVAVNGSTTMLARGKDSQGRYIAGGTFTYATSSAAFVSINASTGVATGVANGSANITATSGAITSNTAAVAVSPNASPIISFGRDTIGVGRGTSVSIPILLSRPSGAPLVVNLAAADTNAYWSTATVTIPANATSANATLIGRNAGSTTVTAVDGSGAGYAPASAVVKVQANIRMAAGGYSLNATDEIATQVLLSDPSPVGGTYVTFSYGTSGIASASPDPAFIPAGQLAADVVVRGLAAGSTTLTPVATGVNGAAASVNVSAAVISFSTTTLRIGAGQYEPNQYLYTQNAVRNALVVTLSSSDSTIAATAPSVTIATGNNYQYFQVNALKPGTATITPASSGWTAGNNLTVVTSTPKLSLCCAYTINSSASSQNMTVYVTDSLGSGHPRISSLSVRMSSSDTSVLKVLDTLGTVPAGSYYANTLRVSPAGPGGTAWVKVTAGGHVADSVKITVIGPALSLYYTSLRIGAGQVSQYQYVAIPNAIATPLTIRLTNSDSTVAATDTLVTIPAGQTNVYFDVRGRSTGTSTFIVSAPGYAPDTALHIVTTPKLQIVGTATLNAYSLYNQNVYVEDSAGTVHNRISDLVLSMRSSDTTVIKIDSTATITAGSYYVPSSIAMSALKPGTAWIYASAPGHPTDSLLMTVQPAKLNLSFTFYDIGALQTQPANSFYAYTPNGRPVPVVVTFTHSNPAALTLSSTTDTIPANSNVAYFGFSALTTGRDTIIASASGYLPDTGIVRVTTPKLLAYLPGSATTTTPPGTATIYAADSAGNVHYVTDTLVIRAVSSDTNVIRPTQQFFRMEKGLYYANPKVQYVGPGTATITYSDSAGLGYVPATTAPVTVVGPSLYIAGGAGKLGTGQHSSFGSYYVQIPNALGTPLTVNLVSTDPRVATAPATVTIAAGATYQYFTITALDTIGTVQIQGTATGYTASSVNMQVTPPKFVLSASANLYTTSPSTNLYVYAADADGTAHYVNQDVVVTLGTSGPSVASIDSSTVTILADQYSSNVATWSPGAVGTAVLSASDARTIRYPLSTATLNVTVSTPTTSLSFGTLSLAPGQYQDNNVSVPNTRTGSILTVPLAHASTPRTNTPASVDISVGSYYASFRVTGTSVGSDTITASPSGHIPAVGIVDVGLGRIDQMSGWPTALRVGDSVQVTMYTRAPDTGVRYVSAATTFALSPASNLQFVSGGAAGSSVTITSVTVPIDTYYTTFWVKGVSAGTGSSRISNANYVTYSSTVTVSP